MKSVPPHVADFLTLHIGSPEDLEVFLACVTAPERWWDASSMASEVGVRPQAAHRSLDHLARSNLLDIRVTADVRYQFNPGTEELRDRAIACAAEYRVNPIGVVQIVTDRRRRIRDFADAFKLRKP